MNNGTNDNLNNNEINREQTVFLNITRENLNYLISQNALLNNNVEGFSMENLNRLGNINIQGILNNPSFRYQIQQQQQQQGFNQPHSHSHNVIQHHGHTHSYNSNDQNIHDDSNQSIALNINNNQDDDSNNNLNHNETDTLNITNEDLNESHEQPNNLIKLALMSLQTNIPILIILFAKVFHQHIIGFLIVLAFLATLHWSNRLLMNQIELKERKSNIKLIILIGFLIGNIALFYFAFDNYQLHYCLVFLETNIKTMDIWNLLWIVVCCDIIAKLITICIKAIVTLLPCRFVLIRKRGCYYSTIESFGLFYRCLIPIHPWILFLLQSKNISNNDLLHNKYEPISETQSSYIFPLILCIVYVIFKLNNLYNRYLELSQVFSELLKDQSYGIPASKLDYDVNSVCPICQDKYSNPVQLKCKHIFCQDCVTIWLDREQTCPMCRSKVSTKKPSFKDGSTSMFIQWY